MWPDTVSESSQIVVECHIASAENLAAVNREPIRSQNAFKLLHTSWARNRSRRSCSAWTAWREASRRPGEWQRVVAAELGAALREVHALECPADPVWRRDVLGELRPTCAARHRSRRRLPEYLIDQLDDYLALPSAERNLLHADLYGDHILVRDGHLAGIIDWGDALCGEPYYDLPALFFGTFGGSKPLLRAFLDAYGWPVGSVGWIKLRARAMTMTLLHEFNPLGQAMPPLEDVRPWTSWPRCSGGCDAGAFRAVLFDWRGTLFHDEDDAAWIRASAASIGQTLDDPGSECPR